jgi:hypothetical protein
LAGTTEGCQSSEVLLLVVPKAVSPVGAVGATEQGAQAPAAVQGWPLPAGPLLVVGLLPWVHQFAL